MNSLLTFYMDQTMKSTGNETERFTDSFKYIFLYLMDNHHTIIFTLKAFSKGFKLKHVRIEKGILSLYK